MDYFRRSRRQMAQRKFPLRISISARPNYGQTLVQGTRWLKIHVTQKNETRPAISRNAANDKPFCLTVAFFATPRPKESHPEFSFLARSPQSMSLYNDVEIPVPRQTRPKKSFDRFAPISSAMEKNEGRNRWPLAFFDTPEKIQRMNEEFIIDSRPKSDATCGRILRQLEAQGVLDNTLVNLHHRQRFYYHQRPNMDFADKWYPPKRQIRVSPIRFASNECRRTCAAKTNETSPLSIDPRPRRFLLTSRRRPDVHHGCKAAT